MKLYFLALLVLSCLAFENRLENNHGKWLEVMENRLVNLKEMNPIDHFHQILGDIHVLMSAFKTYRSEKKGLDSFGYPLVYDSKLTPKYHIYNSDFDHRIQDVLIDGSTVVIRTSHPAHLLQWKLKKGYIFSTAMDFTQSEDEVFLGSKDFLLTEKPKQIGKNIILLENVISLEFGELWSTADIYTNMQHYDYVTSNGSTISRPAPQIVNIYDVYDPTETSNHKSSSQIRQVDETEFFSSIINNIVQTIVSVAEAVQQSTAKTGSELSLNYNQETGKATNSIPIAKLSASGNIAEANSTRNGATGDRSVSVFVGLSIDCTNCWLKATIRTETSFKITSGLTPTFSTKIFFTDLRINTEWELRVGGGLKASAEVPIAGFTSAPASVSVSGKSTSFSLAAGFFVIFEASVEANFVFQFDGKFTLDGWVEFGLRGTSPFFDSSVALKDTEWGAKFKEVEVIFTLALRIGGKLKAEIYNFGIEGFIGGSATAQFALDLECTYKFKGTEENKLKAYAELGVTLPNFVKIALELGALKKEWVFIEYEIKALQGCLFENPKAKPVGTLPIPDCTGVFEGHIYDFNSLKRAQDSPYSITSGNWKYDFNICDKLTSTRCDGNPVGICQGSTQSTTENFDVGKPSTAFVGNSPVSFTVKYENGDACGNKNRAGDIIIECDRSASTPTIVSVEEPKPCEYAIKMKSQLACPSACLVHVGKQPFDFNPLKNNYPTFEKNGFKYTVAFCEQVVNNNCGSETGICQESSDGRKLSLGRPTNYVKAGYGEFIVEYFGGDSAGCSGNRESKVIYKCNSAATTPFISNVEEPAPCKYEIHVQTNIACVATCKYIDQQFLADFNSLALTDKLYSKDSVGYKYEFNICAPATGTKCSKNGVCQTDSHGNNYNLGNTITPIVRLSEDKYKLTLEGGDMCGDKTRKTDLVFKCGSVPKPVIREIKEPKTCEYEINIETESACRAKFEGYQIKTKDFIDDVHFINVGSWEILPETDMYRVQMEVTKIKNVGSDDIFEILIYGTNIELTYLGFDEYTPIDGSLYYYDYYYFDVEGAIFIDIDASIVDGIEYIYFEFNADPEPEIYSLLYQYEFVVPYSNVQTSYIADNILYSFTIDARSERIYYYCVADEGNPHTFIATIDGIDLTEGLLDGKSEYGIAHIPNFDTDTFIFLDIYASGFEVIENLSCFIHPLIYAYGPVEPVSYLSGIIYQFQVNPAVSELHLTTDGSEDIELFMLVDPIGIYESSPVLVGKDITFYYETNNRTDYVFARVNGPSAKFDVVGIVELVEDDGKSNSIRTNDEGTLIDLNYLYRYNISNDFDVNSLLHIEIVTDKSQFVSIVLKNVNYTSFCNNTIDTGFCEAYIPYSVVMENILSDNTFEFTIEFINPPASVVFEILIFISEVTVITDTNVSGFGVGDGDYSTIYYLYTVPDDFNGYAIKFTSTYSDDSFEIFAFNRNTSDAFGGAGEIGTATFAVFAEAGHVFEIDVTANFTGTFSFVIETVATPPRVRITTQDRSIDSFIDTGVVQFSLVLDDPAFFAFDNQTFAQALAGLTVSEEDVIWNQVLELLENDLENSVSYVPFSNEISYRVTGFFTSEQVSDRDLCIAFSGLDVAVPYGSYTSNPFCFRCPSTSCSPICGACESVDDICNADFVCEPKEITNPGSSTASATPTPTTTQTAPNTPSSTQTASASSTQGASSPNESSSSTSTPIPSIPSQSSASRTTQIDQTASASSTQGASSPNESRSSSPSRSVLKTNAASQSSAIKPSNAISASKTSSSRPAESESPIELSDSSTSQFPFSSDTISFGSVTFHRNNSPGSSDSSSDASSFFAISMITFVILVLL